MQPVFRTIISNRSPQDRIDNEMNCRYETYRSLTTSPYQRSSGLTVAFFLASARELLGHYNVLYNVIDAEISTLLAILSSFGATLSTRTLDVPDAFDHALHNLQIFIMVNKRHLLPRNKGF